MSYLNADGVWVRTGVSEADPATVSHPSYDGQQHVVEVDISWTNLPAFGATDPVIASRYVKIPANSIFEKLELVVEVAFDSAGDTATLNVGWVDADDGTSNADEDGFLEAATVAELTATGLTSGTGSPLDVNGYGTKFTEAKYITWDVDTESFTAGVGKLRIFYSTPDQTTDELGT